MAPSLIDQVAIEPLSAPKTPLEPISTCCVDEVAVEKNGLDLSKYVNPSLQVTIDHRIKIVDAPIQEPGKGEVLLHIKATGICGYVSTSLTPA